MASRTLAGWLLKVIHAVVAPDQSCAVPGRYIGDNVSFLRDVIPYASSSNVPVAILSWSGEGLRQGRLALSCVALFAKWVSAPILSSGLICCSVESKMRSMSVVTYLLPSRCRVVFIKAAPWLPFYIFSMLKVLPVTSMPTHLRSCSPRGARAPSYHLPVCGWYDFGYGVRSTMRFLPPTHFLKKAQGLVLTLVPVAWPMEGPWGSPSRPAVVVWQDQSS